MKSVYNYSLSDFEKYFEKIGEKKYKAKQLYNFLYRKKVRSFDEITTFKLELRDSLKKEFVFDDLKVLRHEKSKDAEKFLFKLKDNLFVEAVLMRHDYGNSLCLSSQVGCNMACKFCESGKLKKRRNLEASEMVLQVLKVEELLKEKVKRIVVMGIGEPFDNYDNFTKFIEIINN